MRALLTSTLHNAVMKIKRNKDYYNNLKRELKKIATNVADKTSFRVVYIFVFPPTLTVLYSIVFRTCYVQYTNVASTYSTFFSYEFLFSCIYNMLILNFPLLFPLIQIYLIGNVWKVCKQRSFYICKKNVVDLNKNFCLVLCVDSVYKIEKNCAA